MYDRLMADKSEWKRLRQQLQDAGLHIVKSKAGHWKVFQDNRLITVMGGSPGGGRGLRNQKAHLRRQGINI